MKTVTIELDDQLIALVKAHGEQDLELIIKTALKEYLNRLETPFDKAVSTFRKNILSISHEMEFEVPQIVGYEQWEALDRGTRLSFGKFVKANQAVLGVSFMRKTKSRHAVYKRA